MLLSLLRDYLPFTPVPLQRQLESRRRVLPRLSHQRAWAAAFAPHLEYDPRLAAWTLLQRFTMPLIREQASSAHLDGITQLGLDAERCPGFDVFASRALALTGWTLIPCDHEIEPHEYFAMLAQKMFPCIPRLRPPRAAICADAPDFWHEAIGHIAPLVDPRVSGFYQRCGELYTRAHSSARIEETRELENILWVLLEYGFIRDDEGCDRTFGAALTGSFIAQTKWRLGQWTLEDFQPASVLDSGLYENDRMPRRDERDRIVFFRLKLENAIEQIAEHLRLAQ